MSGTILERDEQGKIVKKSLSSEEAKAMSAKSHAKAEQTKQSEVDILLAEGGYPDQADAPQVLRVVCETIAEGGPRSIQAVVQYRQLTSRQESSAVTAVHPGDICPVCRQYVMAGAEVTGEDRGTLQHYIQQTRSNGNE